MQSVILPTIPDAYIKGRLSENAWLMARVENRVWEERDVRAAEGWPYIVYNVVGAGTSLSHEKRPFLGSWNCYVRAAMRRDMLPAGVQGLAAYLAPPTEQGGIVGELIRTLSGVTNPEAGAGRVWSSQYRDEYRKSYITGSTDVLEMGGQFFLQATSKF